MPIDDHGVGETYAMNGWATNFFLLAALALQAGALETEHGRATLRRFIRDCLNSIPDVQQTPEYELAMLELERARAGKVNSTGDLVAEIPPTKTIQ